MRDFRRGDFAGRDDHAGAHAGPAPDLGRKGHRHADAAVGRRIAWQRAGMQSNARPGDALHVRHPARRYRCWSGAICSSG